MTNDERKRIERLRKNGNSFARIAEITGLSKDSIRMYCSRNNIVPGKRGGSCCQQCGKELSNFYLEDHTISFNEEEMSEQT